MTDRQSVREWLEERRQNALTIAASVGAKNPAAWREDAQYFQWAINNCDGRDELRALWVEWLDGIYDGPDLLRRVRLAVHGPLRKAANSAGTGGVPHVSIGAREGSNNAVGNDHANPQGEKR